MPIYLILTGLAFSVGGTDVKSQRTSVTMSENIVVYQKHMPLIIDISDFFWQILDFSKSEFPSFCFLEENINFFGWEYNPKYFCF